MSLSVNYSDLKPHITELTEFIAHELALNVSQVRQIQYTNGGIISCRNP